MEDTNEDIMPSNYLPTRLGRTYVRYFRFVFVIKKIPKMLTLSEKLYEASEAERNLGISHVESDVLCFAEGGYVTMMIEAADFFVRNPTKSTSFHAPKFYLHRKTLLKKLESVLRDFHPELCTTFADFMDCKSFHFLDEGTSPKQAFLNNMRLHCYDLNDGKKS